MTPRLRISKPFLLVLLIAAVVVCYFPSLHGQFIWDDLDYITKNKTLHSLKGLKDVWLEPRSTTNYYPLLFSVYWLEYQLWGDHALGYHLVNVVLHILNALLAWKLLYKLRIPGAFAAAFLFAIHPLNVESVAWIAEMKNTQSTFFMLLSILFFQYHLDTEPGDKPFLNKRMARYLLSFSMFLCALLTKPVTCVLPGILLLILWLRNGKIERKQVMMLMPYALMAGSFILLVMKSEQNYLVLSDTTLSFTLLERAIIAGKAFWFYLFKLIWPFPLMFIYPKWDNKPIDLLYALFAIGLLIFLLFERRRTPKGLKAAIFYYLMTIAPVLGLLDYQNLEYTYVADHFFYLPSIGLSALLVNAAIYLNDKQGTDFVLLKTTLAVIFVVIFVGLSWQHAGKFKDEITIYGDTIYKDPGHPTSYNLRGQAYFKNGQYDFALSDFERAIKLEPTYYQAIHNRAIIYLKYHLYDLAFDDFSRVIKINPRCALAYYFRGQMHFQNKNYQAALNDFNEAVSLDPRPQEAWQHLRMTQEMLRRSGFIQSEEKFLH